MESAQETSCCSSEKKETIPSEDKDSKSLGEKSEEIKATQDSTKEKSKEIKRRPYNGIRSECLHLLERIRDKFQTWYQSTGSSFSSLDEFGQLALNFFQQAGHTAKQEDKYYCAGAVVDIKFERALQDSKLPYPDEMKEVINIRQRYTQSKLVDFCKRPGFPRQFWSALKKKIEQEDKPQLRKSFRNLKENIDY